MKEVFSRNGGPSMIKSKDKLKTSKLNKDNYILSTLSIKQIIQAKNMIRYKLYLNN